MASTTGAYVYAVVPDSSTCRDDDCDHRYCADPILRFSDCGRVVSFDFEVDTADERRNSFHKLDVMIDSLTKFRDALALEAHRAAAHQALALGGAR